jgi:carbon monoxide dehydrogenase subunit G
MTGFSNEIAIAAPIEVAFAELSDQRNEKRWSPSMEYVELLTPEPIGVGSKLRAKWARSPEAEVTYVEFQRPILWVTRSTTKMMDVTVRLELTPEGTGSRLLSTWTIDPRGPMRLLAPILKHVFNKDVRRSMRAAKNHVEAMHAAASR